MAAMRHRPDDRELLEATLLDKDRRGHDSWVRRFKDKIKPKTEKPTKYVELHRRNQHSDRPKD